jgi:eukaryotic-like serine/threonine-protein kinase
MVVTPTQPLHPGDTLDHYRIDEMVARSATSATFCAVDLRTNQQVAVKVPQPEFETDPTLSDRFRREEEIGEQLNHAGLVKVIPDQDRSRRYIVMEWFDGKSLRQLLLEHRFSPQRATRIVIAICRVLEYIHNRGVVHRDLRPENVLLDAEDHIKLIDFGGAGRAAGRRITFTNVSQITGGSEYISPEELKGKRGDARSDIYALGMILYEMVTGRTPFPSADPFDRIVNHPIPPREIDAALSPQLQEVIYRALERDPRNRYANAHDFARDLEHLDQVGVADRVEVRDWKKARSSQSRKLALYLAMALIPVVIFALLFYFAKR